VSVSNPSLRAMSDDDAIDSPGEVIVNVFGRTDVGRTREHNEDAFVVADLTTDNATLQPEVRRHVLGPKGTLFMVADGMGGAAAGEIASAMAVEVVLGEMREKWVHTEAVDTQEFVRALRRATATANAQIHNFAASHTEYRGMGTTATVAGLLGDTLYVAQVGDSRAYLIRDGVARQITKDQSLMQKLIEAGEMTEEEAAQSDRRNIILQALGPEPMIKVDLTHQQVRRGDVLVLCSDGLSGQVSKDEIARVVSQEPDLVAVCKRLIDRANENGGPDNITVIAARFDGSRLAAPGTTDEVGHRVFPLPETGQVPAVAAEIPPSALDEPRRSSPPGTALDEHPAAAELAGGAGSLGTPDLLASNLAITPAEGTPIVSPSRRQTGMLIALVLLLALVAGAILFILRAAQKVAPVARPTVAPAAESLHRAPTTGSPARDSAAAPPTSSSAPTPRG
jgi:PPM family protein phosphatase